MHLSNALSFLSSLQPTLNFERAGKLFRTRNTTYFYDVGTGKVFECIGKEYEIMNILLTSKHLINDLEVLLCNDSCYQDALQNIMGLCNEENILKVPTYQAFTNENRNDMYMNQGKLKQITLEITQKCNLRCKYCIYNEEFDQFRSFTQEDMSWDVAKAALDYAKEYGADDLIIGFYGGEPLMNIPLLKKCISYCIEHLSNRSELMFTLTSNLTLLDEETAKFFSRIPNMNIVCSLDGPKEIQDRFRVFSNQIGSFENTMKGLQMLVKAFGDEASVRISIHSVLCPPVNDKKMNNLKTFFDNIPWLPKNLFKDVAYVSKDSLPASYFEDKDYRNLENENLNDDRIENPLKCWTLNELCNKDYNNTYALQIEHGTLMKNNLRFIDDFPATYLFRNACCVPAIRKLYVSIDGKLSVCERIGNSPSLGNIKNGVDKEIVLEKYIKEYDTYSLEKCNQCWAMHLCSVCYATCFNEVGLDKQKKEVSCKISRIDALHNLVMYYQLVEENNDIIEYIDQIYMAIS